MATFPKRLTVDHRALATSRAPLSSFCGVAINLRLAPGQQLLVCVIGARHNIQEFVPGLSVDYRKASSLELSDVPYKILARMYQILFMLVRIC